MISIIKFDDRYQMRMSSPGSGLGTNTAQTRDLAEVHLAVDHYFGQPHDKEKCPLCPKTVNVSRQRKRAKASG